MKNIFKKIIVLLSVSLVLANLFFPIHFSLADIVCDPRTQQPTPDRNSCEPLGTYHFLAPLPGVSEEGFNPGTKTGDTTALGRYLNPMIKLFIGLCAVLAVVMFVVGGLEYMTSELVHSKEHGKERMTHAVLGLLLALGAYSLLFTINPDLLKSDVEIPSAIIAVDLQEDREPRPPSLSPYTGTLPTGKAGVCEEGVVRLANGIVVCKSISTNVDRMIAAAEQNDPSLIIWGGGFRTHEQQRELRRLNCGGNISDPKAKCIPPTAVPGHSRHESGLALDLTCDGKIIEGPANACFAWLRVNAGKYGLKNYAAEPWHWSIDGR